MSAIHVTRWGTEGPEVLLVHGGPQGGPEGGAGQFSGQQALASKGWQLVVPDRPGHGQSPEAGPEDMEVDAQWVAELLGERSHLVGHSYGGLIALAAAAARPEAVASLTLVEAPVFGVADEHPDVQAFRAELEQVSTSEATPLERLIAFGGIVRIAPSPDAVMPTMDQLDRMGEAVAEMRPPTEFDGAAALDAVHAAGIPVLAVTGAGNPAFGAIADAIARRTDGEHVVIATGNHFPHHDTEAFNDRLDAFLASAP